MQCWFPGKPIFLESYGNIRFYSTSISLNGFFLWMYITPLIYYAKHSADMGIGIAASYFYCSLALLTKQHN